MRRWIRQGNQAARFSLSATENSRRVTGTATFHDRSDLLDHRRVSDVKHPNVWCYEPIDARRLGRLCGELKRVVVGFKTARVTNRNIRQQADVVARRRGSQLDRIATVVEQRSGKRNCFGPQ